MTEIFAQGDLLIERVPDVAPSGTVAENAEGMPLVLLEGEATGHCHAIRQRVTMFHDDDLARDIPAGLYLGHLRIAAAYARVTHEEHAPLTPPRGTYRVRRQRELGPCDAHVLAIKGASTPQQAAALADYRARWAAIGDQPRAPIATRPKRACGWLIVFRE